MMRWVVRHCESTRSVVTLFVITSFVLILPALLLGNALNGDIPVHVRWQAQFAEQVWRGSLYPHWLPDMNQGFGSPAFFFYPPLLQWLGAVFQPFLPGAEHAMTRLILAVWILSVAGGIGCWLWLRALTLSADSAALGGLVFVLMPYRCFVDVYQRGALAELAGMCVIPWLLYGLTRLKAKRRDGWGASALATGVILYSHLPAAMMGIVFASAYALVLAGRTDWRFVARAISAAVVGFLIGALCVLPALGLLGLLTNTTAMWGSRNQPMNWLLFSAVGWVDGTYPMTILMVLMALVVGGVLSALGVRTTDSRLRAIVLFLGASIVVVVFLNTAPSRGFWALQTPLSRIQFPFRLLSIHAVALSGLAGIAFDRLRHANGARAARLRKLIVLGLPGLFALDSAMLGVQSYRNRDDRPPDNRTIVASTVDTSEYVLGQMSAVRSFFGNARAIAVTGAVTARPLFWGNRSIVLAVTAAAPSQLALRQFAFTGWECRIDHETWHPAAMLRYPLGVPTCRVPIGQHVLEARMPARWHEQVGAGLTLLGLALVLGDIVLNRRRARGDANGGALG